MTYHHVKLFKAFTIKHRTKKRIILTLMSLYLLKLREVKMMGKIRGAPKDNKGFTLIELVMVIVILGVLAATAVPKYISIKTEASDAAAKGITTALRGAVSVLYSQHLIKGATGAAYDMATVAKSCDITGVDGLTGSTNAFTVTIGGKVYGWTWLPANLPDLPGRVIETTGF